ncbi:4-fold beta flower protein [Paeniglutamicibacter terrestris]|uniref:4-fold beta flower protein n=1 Tax=Paeniglutamicibacter terrestris TaxID=2723403 RepID=UPI001AEC564A|nr:hypothetical protein [Paeniglutamicibacter terrestris]
MDPIFNKNGAVVAWLYGKDILDLGGAHRGFVNGSSVISYQKGYHLGWFEQGVFWDSQNRAIGMTRDISASIPRPGLSGVPGRPGIGGRPGRPGIPGTPGKPGRSGGWSTQEWNDWMPSK